jgi:RimJ/RimL family protein N-acetyltransferase
LSPLTLETERLRIRAFLPEEAPAIHRILDACFGIGQLANDPTALAERREWVAWGRLSEKWLDELHQPPYADRAIVLKATGAVIGSVGFVPLLMPFEQLPELAEDGGAAAVPPEQARATAEVGLFWAIDPAHQRQGYATEAARAMIDYAFSTLRLKRIMANTDFSNTASQGVMLKLGMRLARNPWPQPFWLQVIGFLDYPDSARG